jgi:hypothetical protein
VGLAGGENAHGLAGRQPPEARNPDLDHEAAAWLEVGSGVLEAGDLLVLRRQVPDRVEDEVGERERIVDARGREVADRHVDVVGPRLRAQPRDHRLRKVDPAHADTAPGQRQRDPTGADAELECGTVSSELCEEVHHGVDDRRVEHRRVLVVTGGDRLAEVVLGHPG